MSLSRQPFKTNDSMSKGKEIFEIKPVFLGGSPTDPANKIALTRNEHIQAVCNWSNVIRKLRQKSPHEWNLAGDSTSRPIA
jgi:hypothetical protein